MTTNLSVTSETPRCDCPYCGRPVDRASGPREVRPGDVSVCIGCRCFCVYADDLTLRRPTDEEAAQMAGNEDLRRIVAALAAVERRTPRGTEREEGDER